MILTFCFMIGQFDANAQTGGEAEGVQIVASPKGAIVQIDGEYGIAGSAPYTIKQGIDGFYRIRATYPGYEDYDSKFQFKPGVNHRISIRLTRKTRARAFMRSFIVPGWGQSYTGQKTKSYFIRSASLAALTYLIVREVKYQDAVDNFEKAVSNYQANQKNSELASALFKEVQSTQSTVDKRFERRRTALIIAGSVYLYNVLDAFFFFPDFDIAGLNFSVKPNIQDSSLKFGFSARL